MWVYMNRWILTTLSLRCCVLDMRHYKEWIKIGLNILYYRKEQRLTQQQLADLCGENGVSRGINKTFTLWMKAPLRT